MRQITIDPRLEFLDELMIIGAIACAPVYGFAIWAMWTHASYQMHTLAKIDQSATETATTETVPATK
jgi:hypothetical protein